MSERETLEIEVAAHRARVEEITATLAEAPEDSTAQLLRLELKGRSAAVAVGSARLRMLRD